jgi:hypothetical protein
MIYMWFTGINYNELEKIVTLFLRPLYDHIETRQFWWDKNYRYDNRYEHRNIIIIIIIINDL